MYRGRLRPGGRRSNKQLDGVPATWRASTVSLALSLMITFVAWDAARGFLNEAFIDAVREDDAGTVRVLLTLGADARTRDYTGTTLLMYAASLDRRRAAELLIRAGAEVNARDWYGRTALMRAAWAGDSEVVRSLPLKGADPNAVDAWGETALACAAERHQAAAAELLECAGA